MAVEYITGDKQAPAVVSDGISGGFQKAMLGWT